MHEDDIVEEGEHDISCVLEGNKWSEGQVSNGPERGKHANHLAVDHFRAAEDVDEGIVELWVDKALAGAADRDLATAARVNLIRRLVEGVEARVALYHLRLIFC